MTANEAMGGGGPFHVAKSFEAERRSILYFGDLAINQFESDEVAIAVASDANDQFKYWAKSHGWAGPSEVRGLERLLDKALDEKAILRAELDAMKTPDWDDISRRNAEILALRGELDAAKRQAQELYDLGQKQRAELDAEKEKAERMREALKAAFSVLPEGSPEWMQVDKALSGLAKAGGEKG